MRAAQRNATIAQAKAEKRGRNRGSGPLRLCAGQAPVQPPPAIVSKHQLRRQRQRAQREAESP